MRAGGDPIADLTVAAVVFDLRGTLVDPASGWRFTDRERIRFLRSRGASQDDAELHELIDDAVAAVNALALRQTAYFEQDRWVLERVAERLGIALPAASLDRFEQERNRTFVRTVQPFPDAQPTLRALRRRGLATGCVADGGRHWMQLVLKRCGLSRHLDVAVASQQSGEVKATGAALRLACARLGVQPREVLYVGDRLDKDVRMARQVGALPLLLARSPQSDTREPAISSLTELLAVVCPSHTHAAQQRWQATTAPRP